jgi:hypothetical protein
VRCGVGRGGRCEVVVGLGSFFSELVWVGSDGSDGFLMLVHAFQCWFE